MTSLGSRKAVVFLIDRTWQPILQACIDATAMVFKDHLDTEDMVAFYSMGPTFQNGGSWAIIEMQRKGKDPDGLYKRILRANKLAGGCELYSSIHRVLTLTSFSSLFRDESISKWLIVLTDLVDLNTATHQVSSTMEGLCKVMTNAMAFNLAIIDSQTISGYEPKHERWPEWRRNASRLVDEVASSSGNKAYHIPAHSAEDIQAAFSRVASLMSNQAEEAL